MWKTISSKEVFRHPRLTLVEDQVILPSGIKTDYLKFANDKDAVTIIAKRNDGKILVQKEYSYPPNREIFQFPGGMILDGESPEFGANRELMEEADLAAGKLELLSSHLNNNRRSSSRMWVYLATDLRKESIEGDQEEGSIEHFWFSEDEIDEMIRNDKVENCHMLASWSFYKLKK